MPKLNEIYRCNICGNIVEIVGEGFWQLVCCGENMEFLIEQNEDIWKEKHVPVVSRKNGTTVVNIGSQPHPMISEHYIQWVQLIGEKLSIKKFLQPGDHPEVEFENVDNEIIARQYCNLHWLRSNKKTSK